MKLCLVVVGLVVVRSTVGVPSLSSHSRPEFDVRCMKTSQPTGENQPTRCLDSRRVKKSLLKKITGKRKRRRVAQTARSPVATRARVTRESTGMEPSLGHDRGGSLQWLPARVKSDLPRLHTQRYGRCQNSRYSSARDAEYLLVGLLVRPVGHQDQSLVIALRSPATKRSSASVCLSVSCKPRQALESSARRD